MDKIKDDKTLYTSILSIYGISIAIIPVVIIAWFGMKSFRSPSYWTGMILAWIVLSINMYTSGDQDFKDDYTTDMNDSHNVLQSAFYAAAIMFALGSLASNMDSGKVKEIIPHILISIVFILMGVLPPFYTHEEEHQGHILIVKTTRASSMTIAIGFMIIGVTRLLGKMKAE